MPPPPDPLNANQPLDRVRPGQDGAARNPPAPPPAREDLAPFRWMGGAQPEVASYGLMSKSRKGEPCGRKSVPNIAPSQPPEGASGSLPGLDDDA